MKNLFLDIETLPLKITHEDIKSYLMDKKITKQARSFDPNYSKIIVIGIKSKEETKILLGEEKIILQEFWNYLKEQQYVKIITHNGYKFDIPFLTVRSYINHVKPSISINTNPWQMHNSNHFDVMLFFSHHENFLNLNLEILGKMHGIEVPGERLEASEIEKTYHKEGLEKIQEKCRQDLEILEKIHEKFFL